LRRKRRLPRPGLSLLAKFGVVSAIPVILSSLVLGRSLDSIVQKRTLAFVREQAELVTDLQILPHLSPGDMTGALTREDAAEFSAGLSEGPIDDHVVGLRIWNEAKQPVFQNGGKEARALPDPDLLDQAFAGDIVSDKADLTKASEDEKSGLIQVFVPLKFQGSEEPVGVAQLFLPYARIAQVIQQDNHRLYLILLCGFTLVYALLFRIVAKASTKLRQQAEENEYLAHHDSLTGLPNRSLFLERANQALLNAKREGWQVCVMIMDLDRFKEINDTLGHHHGDLVLQEIGRRLLPLLRETDTVARLGGDEFAVLLPHVDQADATLNVATKIHKALERPFYVRGLALDIDASVGIALFPSHGKDIHTLVRRADVAMYVAKSSGLDRQIYNEEIDTNTPDKLGLGGDLRNAIERNELILNYQPILSLRDQRVRNVEALVRWNHPGRGVLPPSEFIDVAERGGLILPLTRTVLDNTLRQVHQWDSEGFHINVAVNLSVKTLLDPGLSHTVAGLLKKWKLDPIRLELEITESAIMADPVRAMEVLTALNNLGVRLAIDDFGTGYSSLAALKRLPIDAVKIDKSFVRQMEQDENDLMIVQSIIELSHNLGLEVVAEGVETEDISRMLTLLGCDYIQGWHRGRPVPAKEVPWLLGVMEASPDGAPLPPPPPLPPGPPPPPPSPPGVAMPTPSG
jgi:diguanylate cyclase (GGDEF)-like protein